jgi:hypothetical protein
VFHQWNVRDRGRQYSRFSKRINIVTHCGNDKTLTDIDKRLEELQAELLKLASSKPTITSPRRFTARARISRGFSWKAPDSMK